MNFNPAPGIIYDAIMYNIIYFCKDIFFKTMKTYIRNDDDVLLYYNKFRSTMIDTPPESLYPFFYYVGEGPCALSGYFIKHFNYFNGTYRDFFSSLNNKAQLKRAVLFYILEPYRDQLDIEAVLKEDPKSITEAVVLLRSHGSRLRSFVRLFYEFDDVANELKKYMETLVFRLRRFHEKYKEVVMKAIERFSAPDVVKVYVKKSGMSNLTDISSQTFSVTLLHPTVLIWRNEGDNFAFILSTNAYSALPLYVQYKNISPYSIATLFSNETIRDIIGALNNQEETITRLSMQLHVSRTTIDRLVNLLHNECAVVVSRLEGNEKYYRINPEYFLVAKNKFDREFEELSERWRKMRL